MTTDRIAAPLIRQRRRRQVAVLAPNARSAGSLTLWPPLIDSLLRVMPETDFTAVLPRAREFHTQTISGKARVSHIVARKGVINDLQRAWDLTCGFALALRRMHADAVLCVDVPPTWSPCPVVVFLNQALLVYSRSELGNQDSWHWLKRRWLTWHFSGASRGSRIIVQTPVMAARLTRRYGIQPSRISVVAQPSPADLIPMATSGMCPPALAECKKPTRLLLLAAYYPHKNHAVLPAVVRELRRRELAARVQIFATLSPDDAKSHTLRKTFAEDADVVTNLGVLNRQEAAASLARADALFLPTLAESYGLVYLEAMALGKPILTSDRDFAHWMCGPAALYFDPLSPNSIVSVITQMATKTSESTAASETIRGQLSKFPTTWDDSAQAMAGFLRDALG